MHFLLPILHHHLSLDLIWLDPRSLLERLSPLERRCRRRGLYMHLFLPVPRLHHLSLHLSWCVAGRLQLRVMIGLFAVPKQISFHCAFSMQTQLHMMFTNCFSWDGWLTLNSFASLSLFFPSLLGFSLLFSSFCTYSSGRSPARTWTFWFSAPSDNTGVKKEGRKREQTRAKAVQHRKRRGRRKRK